MLLTAAQSGHITVLLTGEQTLWSSQSHVKHSQAGNISMISVLPHYEVAHAGRMLYRQIWDTRLAGGAVQNMSEDTGIKIFK